MGGRPLEAMALLGLGINRLSITPAGIGPVKAMIRSLDLGALRADIGAMLAHPASDPRGQYRDWAIAHGVDLGE
jgi:phosphotransferase system enzyme I (PtsP)